MSAKEEALSMKHAPGAAAEGAAACINNVERIAVFVRYGAGADGAVLALKDNVNVFGKICGDEGWEDRCRG